MSCVGLFNNSLVHKYCAKMTCPVNYFSCFFFIYWTFNSSCTSRGMFLWFCSFYHSPYKHHSDLSVFLKCLLSSCVFRDQSTAGGAAEMSGPADGNASPAAAGPSGLLQKEGRNWAGVLQEPGEAGWALHGQDPEHQGSPAVQVRRCLPVFLLSVHSCHYRWKVFF